jgi:nucleoside 2-deoxyribosyltransferase
MKIMISGSMAFAQEMLATKKALDKLGHEVLVPHDIELHLADEGFVDNLSGNIKHATETDIIRKCFELVAESDAVLVLNLPRKGINGYIGTSTLMEIGLAYYLRKKIYLMHPVPHFDEVRWAHEITIMQPTVIHGDLKKIA